MPVPPTPARNAMPQAREELLHALRRLVLLERELGMRVDPAPQRDHVVHPAVGGGVHTLRRGLHRGSISSARP